MQKKIKQFFEITFQFLKDHAGWVILGVTLLGFGVYTVRSWELAHNLTTRVWDEAMYLYKGSLFASGEYQPFEDYGPWTNQLPVSFLIPGYIQEWFGAGMRSGRMLAFSMGMLTVAGIWLAARRIGNGWWAAAAVWVLALNSGWIKAFNQVYSQGMISFFFAWMLALAVGKDRKTWELCLAAFFAGLAAVARINVFPVVFLFMLYVIWQYGWKKGGWVIAAGLLPIIVVHALYWPDILKIWAYWIPPELFSGIVEYRSPWREIFLPDDFSWFAVGDWISNPNHLAWKGISIFFQSLRANFLPFFGAAVSLLLWPKKDAWRDTYDRKLSIFLIATYLIMLSVHIWAAMGGKTCQFSCMPGYMLFFDFFGLILLPLIIPYWESKPKTWQRVALIVLIFFLIFAMEFTYGYDYHNVRRAIGQKSLWINVPRISGGELLPGSVPILTFLENYFGEDKFGVRQWVLYDPGLVTLVAWVKIIGLAFALPWLVHHFLTKRKPDLRPDFSRIAVFGLISVSVIFASSRFFVQGLDAVACEDDVIVTHEQVGVELNEVIPPGSTVFWDVKSDMLLLYLTDVEIFNPQLNFRFTLVDDPDADWDELRRFSWWNYSLGEEWISQSDYIVVEQRFFDSIWGWPERVEAGEFEIVLRSSPPESCRAGLSNVFVLKPIPQENGN